MSAAVRMSSDDLDFDLSGNSVVDSEDRRVWVEDVYGTLFGDASLDNQVSFIDFTSLSFFFGKAGGWEQGDFDGNGFVQFPDFLLLSRNFGKSAENVATVPEPSGRLMISLFALTLACRRDWRRLRLAQRRQASHHMRLDSIATSPNIGQFDQQLAC